MEKQEIMNIKCGFFLYFFSFPEDQTEHNFVLNFDNVGREGGRTARE